MEHIQWHKTRFKNFMVQWYWRHRVWSLITDSGIMLEINIKRYWKYPTYFQVQCDFFFFCSEFFHTLKWKGLGSHVFPIPIPPLSREISMRQILRSLLALYHMKCGPQTTTEAVSKSLFEMQKSQSEIQPTKSESPLSQDVWGA